MKILRIAAVAFVLALVSGVAFADSLELADGTLIEGDFVGSSNGIIMFNVGDSIEAYPESEFVGIFLSDGVETAAEIAAAPPKTGTMAPAGTRLVIRTMDTIDTRKHGAGHKFRGQLEGALVVDGVTVAAKVNTFITVAGDMTPQRITAATTTSYTISPGLISAVANDAVVTA